MVSFKTCLFIIKLKDFCDTCVHFEWKKTNTCLHDQDTACARRSVHDKCHLLANLRICDLARIVIAKTFVIAFCHRVKRLLK